MVARYAIEEIRKKLEHRYSKCFDSVPTTSFFQRKFSSEIQRSNKNNKKRKRIKNRSKRLAKTKPGKMLVLWAIGGTIKTSEPLHNMPFYERDGIVAMKTAMLLASTGWSCLCIFLKLQNASNG